jgi:hypothetical protein
LSSYFEALPFAESLEDFATVVEGSPTEIVEDAIALSGDQPRRKQLEVWLRALEEPVKQWQWSELPSLWSILRWIDRTQEVRLLAISADGFCQVQSLISGLITNTQ